MTIFTKAAKLLMLKRLDDFMEDAIAKKQGVFGNWRNIDLSKAQKELTQKLHRQIDEFESEECDQVSLTTLKSMITQTDSEVEATRKLYGYERGNLNDTLISMNSALERFYNALTGLSFQLSDIKDDNTPFHIFCTQAAYYFGENIFYPDEGGFLARTVTNIVGTSPVTIREQKEACLLHHLNECFVKLNAIKDGDQYNDLRKELVLGEVKEIQRKNAQICKDSQLITSIPVNITFMATANVSAPKLRPSKGRLEICMQKVVQELDPPKITLDSPKVTIEASP